MTGRLSWTRRAGALAATILGTAAGAALAALDAGSPAVETFPADALVRIDDLGRVALFLDDLRDGRDGLVAHAFVYVPSVRLRPSPDKRVRDVTVRIESAAGAVRSVRVDAGQPVLDAVELAIDAGGREVLEGAHDRLRARNGAALLAVGGGRCWPDVAVAPRRADGSVRPPSFDEARTEHLAGLAPPPTGRAGDDAAAGTDSVGAGCDKGGRGATSCSASCKGTIYGFTIGEDCSVSCGPTPLYDTYACCGCGGFLAAFGDCYCVPDFTTPRKSDALDLDPGDCVFCY